MFICQHTNYQKLYTIDKFEFIKCLDCGLVLNIKSSQEDYVDYYQKDNSARFNFFIELIVKFFRFKRAIQVKLLSKKAKSILDIGSGRGYMLFYLKKYFNFKKTVGTQISLPAYNFSKNVLNLEIYNQDLLKINLKERFDIISLYHVLEHISEVEEYLLEIHKLLNRSGSLIIQVPNYSAWSRLISQKRWLALDPQHHTVFFNFKTLKNLLNKHGFKVVSHNSFSLEYSIFTSSQSLINYITKTNNYLFDCLQNKKYDIIFLGHLGLFIVITLITLIINLILFFSPYGENVNIIAKKNAERQENSSSHACLQCRKNTTKNL